MQEGRDAGAGPAAKKARAAGVQPHELGREGARLAVSAGEGKAGGQSEKHKLLRTVALGGLTTQTMEAAKGMASAAGTVSLTHPAVISQPSSTHALPPSLTYICMHPLVLMRTALHAIASHGPPSH